METTLIVAETLPLWEKELQAADRDPTTVKKYGRTIRDLLAWFEGVEHRSLIWTNLTPIAPIGYRNRLQHQQAKATNTVNRHVSASRVQCAWLVEQQYLDTDPDARLKIVGRQDASKREVLEAIFIYQLALLYRFEHDLGLCIGLKAFLKAL